MLQSLPPELIIAIASNLESKDLNMLTRTGRYFHTLCNKTLYRNNARYEEAPNTALHWGALKDKLSTAKLAIEERNYRDNGKWPEALRDALTTAAYYGSTEVFSLLLSLGSGISLGIGPNIAAETPSILRVMAHKGISPEVKPRTLLEVAALGGHIRVVKILISHPNFKATSERPDLLGYLVKTRRAGAISCVLQGSNIDPNQPFIDSTGGISAAAWCVLENDPKVLAPFMRPGVREKVDFTLPNGDRERFPFSLASAEFGGIETFKMLATVPSFKINAQSENGYTALHWAVRYGNAVMAAFLLQGADPAAGWKVINDYLKSKVMSSAITKAVDELRHEPLDIDRVDGQGRTALHFAVQRREFADNTPSTNYVLAIIIMLLQYGANPEIGWEDGQYNGPAITPLAQAIMNRDGDLDVINLLLDTSKVSLELAKKQLPRDILSARKSLFDQLEHRITSNNDA